MAEKFIIRRAVAPDSPAICRMHERSIRVLATGDYSPEQIEAWAGHLRPEGYVEAMEKRGEYMFIALDQERIVGFSSYLPATLQAVYVDPDFVRRGVGSQLLLAVEAHGKDHGDLEMQVISSLNARRFYEKFGYQAVERIERKRHGVMIPSIVMKKKFSSGIQE